MQKLNLWQEYDCPHGSDSDIDEPNLVHQGQKFACHWCGGEHVAGVDVQVATTRDWREQLDLPKSAVDLQTLMDQTTPGGNIEVELQTLRKKVATYEARDALGLVPQPPGTLGPDGKEWAKTAAGYAHVEAMLPRADGQGSSPFWYGWALRGAFVAGAEWQESRAAQADKPRAVSDTIRLDVMHANRVAVIPEDEGPWDAEVYGEGEEPAFRVSGNTPRAALDAAIEALSELEANNARLR